MGALVSTLRPPLTSVFSAVEPESSYGDLFRGRGKKVHPGWKLKGKNHEKDGCKRQSSAQFLVGTWKTHGYSLARRKVACTHAKSLNHLNDVYCFLGHTVLVCKTWLSCPRSLTLSLLKTISLTCFLVLIQERLPGCLFALPSASQRDLSTGSCPSMVLELHLWWMIASHKPARQDFAAENNFCLLITSHSTTVFLVTSSIT